MQLNYSLVSFNALVCLIYFCLSVIHEYICTQVDDGLDTLLQIVAQYRKRDPEGSEERVQNIFLCLCTALMDTTNQNHFRACEGIELMLRCLKEKGYAASCAGRVVTYAVQNNR